MKTAGRHEPEIRGQASGVEGESAKAATLMTVSTIGAPEGHIVSSAK